MTWLTPITLSGQHVTLAPLSHSHYEDLLESLYDGELWKLWYTLIPEPKNLDAEITRRLDLQAQSKLLPFTIINNKTNKAIGMTCYLNLDKTNKRLEIGSTWLRKSAQGTNINKQAKYLLLQHAFEKLHCIAVEFRTHFCNIQSRKGIESLGAKPDGVLRNHMIMRNGTIRDTCVYSILNSEWATIKSHLEWKLGERNYSVMLGTADDDLMDSRI